MGSADGAVIEPMSDDEKERQRTSIAAMETDVAVAKWCMFCGNCCNDKTAEVIERDMMAASGISTNAAMMADWCMFCGNCCNGLTTEVAMEKMKQSGNGKG